MQELSTLMLLNKVYKSSDGPVSKEVPVSAITLHPPLHAPTSFPPTKILSA